MSSVLLSYWDGRSEKLLLVQQRVVLLVVRGEKRLGVRQSTTDVRPRQLGAAVAKVSFSSPPPSCRGQGEAATT